MNVTAAQYYVKQGGTCASIATPPNVVMYTANQVADPSPTGTIIKGPDRGRIGTFYWVGPDQIPIAVGNFDQQLGLPCTPFGASDGMLRCLPSQPVTETADENATCAGSAASFYGECFGAPPLRGPSYTSCIDGPFRVRPIPTTFTSASLESDGTCAAVDLPDGLGFDLSTFGSELPPSMFPALTELVE